MTGKDRLVRTTTPLANEDTKTYVRDDDVDDAGEGASGVVFQGELAFERVDDRLDPLAAAGQPARIGLVLKRSWTPSAQFGGTETPEDRD